jgi:hypothetical protein
MCQFYCKRSEKKTTAIILFVIFFSTIVAFGFGMMGWKVTSEVEKEYSINTRASFDANEVTNSTILTEENVNRWG